MIAIKKVAVSPIPRNEASVIDSFDTTDDKTINAPSINAVENYVGEEIAETKAYVDEQIINTTVITNSPTSSTTVINYPEGYTYNNSVILSFMSKTSTTGAWALETTAGLYLGSSNITLGNGTQGYTYKITLMKVS